MWGRESQGKCSWRKQQNLKRQADKGEGWWVMMNSVSNENSSPRSFAWKQGTRLPSMHLIITVHSLCQIQLWVRHHLAPCPEYYRYFPKIGCQDGLWMDGWIHKWIDMAIFWMTIYLVMNDHIFHVTRNISIRDSLFATKINPTWGWGRMNWETGIDTYTLLCIKCFPGGSDNKESTCNEEDLDLIPGLGRSPGGRHGNPLQYSCLENSMNRGAWRGPKESDTTEWLSTHNV